MTSLVESYNNNTQGKATENIITKMIL